MNDNTIVIVQGISLFWDHEFFIWQVQFTVFSSETDEKGGILKKIKFSQQDIIQIHVLISINRSQSMY